MYCFAGLPSAPPSHVNNNHSSHVHRQRRPGRSAPPGPAPAARDAACPAPSDARAPSWKSAWQPPSPGPARSCLKIRTGHRSTVPRAASRQCRRRYYHSTSPHERTETRSLATPRPQSFTPASPTDPAPTHPQLLLRIVDGPGLRRLILGELIILISLVKVLLRGGALPGLLGRAVVGHDAFPQMRRRQQWKQRFLCLQSPENDSIERCIECGQAGAYATRQGRAPGSKSYLNSGAPKQIRSGQLIPSKRPAVTGPRRATWTNHAERDGPATPPAR